MDAMMISKESRISVAHLADAVSADFETGALVWKHRPVEHFVDRRAASIWNSQNEGKRAFSRLNRDGYYVGCFQTEKLMAHRVLMALHLERWPGGYIDHINGDRSDNRVQNLRVVSHKENARNARLQVNNSTGATGVVRVGGRFRSEVRVNGKKIYLGYYLSVEEARRARSAADLRFGFHHNHGRPA